MFQTLRWKIAQYAERIWWKKYLKNKDTTLYLVWKKKYWQTILEKYNILQYLKPTDVLLDAGCGPAGIFINFPSHQVYAFDPLLDFYEKNLIHFKKSLYPNVHFYTNSLENFKSPVLVDSIFCMNAINHVKNIEESYTNLVRLLKPNAYIFITIDAHNYTIYRKIFAALPGDILHPHQYCLDEYNTFLTDRDCRILETHLLEKHYFFNHYLIIAQKK